MNGPTPKAFDNLLIIRGIAASAVVLSHLLPHALLFSGWGTNFATIWLLPNGFQSVWVFFTLSSFLLTTAFLQGRFTTARQFWLTRARRLLPGFYTVQLTIIALVLLGVTSSDYGLLTLREVRREIYILLFAPWVPYSMASQSLNSPIWSVVLEVHFIILLPFIVRFATSKVLFGILALWIFALSYICARNLSIWPRLYETHYYNAGFFAFGMLAARAKHAGIEVKKARLPIIITTILAVICLNAISNINVDIALQYGPFLLAPAFFALLMSVNTSIQKKLPTNYKDLIPTLSTRSVFEKIGAMSYSVYLLHKFIGYNLLYYFSIEKYTKNLAVFWAVLSLIVVLVVAISAIFYIEIESRFRSRSKPKMEPEPLSS